MIHENQQRCGEYDPGRVHTARHVTESWQHPAGSLTREGGSCRRWGRRLGRGDKVTVHRKVRLDHLLSKEHLASSGHPFGAVAGPGPDGLVVERWLFDGFPDHRSGRYPSPGQPERGQVDGEGLFEHAVGS